MTLSFPYGLDFLAQCLGGERIPLDLKRYDEMSGVADGRIWARQRAAPLWTVSYSLYSHRGAKAREINAKVRALDGMSKTLLWADPYYSGPASGVTTGLGGVTVASIRQDDGGALGLAGLPVGFVLSAGDYISINYGGGRIYFGEFAEGGTAGGAGGLGPRELRPYLPFGIPVGASVELLRPRLKMMVTEFTPFANFRGRWGDNASITLLQKP